MKYLFPPYHYANQAEAKSEVDKAEALFNNSISDACNYILGTNSHIFGLAGPTCSGKTTTAHKLESLISSAGRNLHIISTDDFYHDRDYLLAHSRCSDGHIDFDSIETIDLEALGKCIESIVRHGFATVPVFDFVTGKAATTRTVGSGDNSKDVFLFEGIHAATPEVARLMPKGCDYACIYIDVDPFGDTTQNMKGSIPDGRTVRLARRIIRDFRFRNATPDFTLSLWKNVVAGEKKGLEPYRDLCSVRLNSYLGYELSVLKKPLEELLEKVTEPAYKSLKQSLLSLVDGVSPLEESIVPQGSVYREFIG